MIITKNIASLGKLVSNSESRPMLENIRFKGNEAMACDVYILGIIKTDEEVKGERFVPGKLVAKKPKTGTEIIFSEKPEIRELKTKEGVSVTQYIEFDGEWPNTDKYIKEARENDGFEVSLGYKVLKKLVDAMSLHTSRYENPSINLKFNKDNCKAIHGEVKTSGGLIELVIMPAKK